MVLLGGNESGRRGEGAMYRKGRRLRFDTTYVFTKEKRNKKWGGRLNFHHSLEVILPNQRISKMSSMGCECVGLSIAAAAAAATTASSDNGGREGSSSAIIPVSAASTIPSESRLLWERIVLDVWDEDGPGASPSGSAGGGEEADG